MHLVDVETLQLKTFSSEARLMDQYAILSHRWLDPDEEVTYQDMKSLDSSAKDKKGYLKLVQTSRLAKSHGLPYVWIDTCCINKSDSSELQEAINSMYRWYQNAAVCYVHLKDQPATTDAGSSFSARYGHDEWFSRGWTLQELIAPRALFFYDYRWDRVGGKRQLAQQLSQITGVDAGLLEGSVRLDHFSIASRMSWASRRITLRPEDQSYSLFGLFGVHMPMLYGEGGEHAFLRLQEEIIKINNDHSIFAWKGVNEPCGLLARSAKAFEYSNNMQRIKHSKSHYTPFAMTNMGLQISLLVVPWTLGVYRCRLNCTFRRGDFYARDRSVGIFLQTTGDDNQYMRVSVGQTELFGFDDFYLGSAPGFTKKISMYIPQRPGMHTSRNDYQIPTSLLVDIWHERQKTSRIYPLGNILLDFIKIEVPRNSGGIEAIKVAWDLDFKPAVFLGEARLDPSILNWIKKGGLFVFEEGDLFGLVEANHGPGNRLLPWNAKGARQGSSQDYFQENALPGLWALRGDYDDRGLWGYTKNPDMSISLDEVGTVQSKAWRLEIKIE